MFENGWTEARVTGILLAHPYVFGSGELKYKANYINNYLRRLDVGNHVEK